DQRVVAPDSSSRRQAFIDRDPPKPPSTEATRLARPLERNSWSRSLVFCRATSRLDTSSRSAIAITPQNEPISALLWAITPQSTSWPIMALIGHHKVNSPRLGRNHALWIAWCFEKPDTLHTRMRRKPKKAIGRAR